MAEPAVTKIGTQLVVSTGACRIFLQNLFGGDDFQPVTVRVVNKINTHGRIFIADAAHLLMQGIGCGKICRGKSQVELIFTQIIRFFAVFQPGQFQLVGRFFVSQVYQDKIRGFLFPDYLQS